MSKLCYYWYYYYYKYFNCHCHRELRVATATATATIETATIEIATIETAAAAVETCSVAQVAFAGHLGHIAIDQPTNMRTTATGIANTINLLRVAATHALLHFHLFVRHLAQMEWSRLAREAAKVYM